MSLSPLLVDSARAIAVDSPILVGVLAIVAAAAAISVVKFVVGLAVRVAIIAGIVLAALVAVGYLG